MRRVFTTITETGTMMKNNNKPHYEIICGGTGPHQVVRIRAAAHISWLDIVLMVRIATDTAAICFEHCFLRLTIAGLSQDVKLAMYPG
jgi:hypothetical protein